jgi:uncharacterized membrane-anchored protein
MTLPIVLLSLLALFSSGVLAQATEPHLSKEEFEATLKYQQGEVALPQGIATLKVPTNFRYLGPEDAQRILEQAWGNPTGDGTLGMLFPTDVSPLDEHGWGVVITYDEDGHVSDDDADGIDYEQLLKDMREGAAAANAERAKQGQEPVELVGWAARPYYDKAAKKLHWAKELRFPNAPEHTLNYNIRILGRKGVLVLNAVANMSQLAAIQTRMTEVLAFTEFNPGHGYADFDPAVDKTAAYGLAALVAGGVAAKAGLFAKLFAVLIAAKKIIAVAVVALIALLRKVFARKA